MGQGSALAQRTPAISADDAVSPTAIVEGAGVKVGEGTVLRPQVGIELGMVSNVFYEDTDPHAAGLMRILLQVGAGSLSPQRLAPVESDDQDVTRPRNVGDFQYRADLRLNYDYFPSTNDRVRDQGGLGVGALFRGIVNPERPLQFAIFENYERVLRPTNFESSDNINRDINQLRLSMQWAPSGRSLSGVLSYENRIDVFERKAQRFANRFQNTFGVRLNWQLFPKTRLFADFTQGIFTGLGDSSIKVTSYPMSPTVGIRTLLTPAISLAMRVGYANGFYAEGPSYSTVVFGTEVGYAYSPLGRLTGAYHYLHNDSINANFYRDHVIRVSAQHAFTPFLGMIQGELIFRNYQGVIVMGTSPNRSDVIAAVMAQLSYNFRDWLATAVDYRFTTDQTDFLYTVDGFTDDPSYVRHEVLVGVRAAY
ncbi:MAG: hypothetical protein ACTHU0_11925 [Kofleriaceae bacterium]